MEPIFFGSIDPDSHKNHREYDDAPTCVRCGRAIRTAGFVIWLSGGEWIVGIADIRDGLLDWALGSECARRVPATHRVPMDTAARERIMTRDREYRAQRGPSYGHAVVKALMDKLEATDG